MLVNIVCDLSCLKKNATLVSGWVGWWGGAGTFSPGRCHHQAGPVFSVAEVPPTDTTTSSPDPLSKGRGGGEGGFFNSPPPPTNTTTTPTPRHCSLQRALGKPAVVCLCQHSASLWARLAVLIVVANTLTSLSKRQGPPGLAPLARP